MTRARQTQGEPPTPDELQMAELIKASQARAPS